MVLQQCPVVAILNCSDLLASLASRAVCVREFYLGRQTDVLMVVVFCSPRVAFSRLAVRATDLPCLAESHDDGLVDAAVRAHRHGARRGDRGVLHRELDNELLRSGPVRRRRLVDFSPPSLLFVLRKSRYAVSCQNDSPFSTDRGPRKRVLVGALGGPRFRVVCGMKRWAGA
jgi:hypothetical protein